MRPVLTLASALLVALITSLPATARAQERVIDVGLGEWAVGLQTETIRPGPVIFIIRNNGNRAHGLRIRARSQHGHKLRGRDRMRVRTGLITPGSSTQLRINLVNGIYRIDCFVEDDAGDHSDMGMKTTLTVSDTAPALEQKQSSLNPTAISIERFTFSPRTLTVKSGSRINWTNKDKVGHTVTHEEGDFSSEELEQGAGFSQLFKKPGSYPYFFALHPNMKGEVIVEP